jgi:hypothetical protein
MVYVPTIPQAGDIPSQSQPQILENFGQANTLFNVNHYTFNDPTVANRGKHRYIVMPRLAAGPALAADEGSLFTKDIGGTSLCWQRFGGPEVRLYGPDPTLANPGRVYLPGGVLIQWGRELNVPGTGNSVVAYSTPFAAVYSVIAQKEDLTTTQSWCVHNVGAANFQIYNSSSGAKNYYWIAIGAS